MRNRVHVAHASRAAMTEALHKAGLGRSADRLGYLQRLAEEDPDEEPIAIESLRQLTGVSHRRMETWRTADRPQPGRRRPGAMARHGDRGFWRWNSWVRS